MNILFQKIASIILSVATIFGMGGGVASKADIHIALQPQTSQYVENSLKDGQIFGSTLPIAGLPYNLSGAGVSSSATSITLNSLTIKQTGQKILDADLSDTFYVTLEPGNNSKQEIVGCTTVTQNGSGTATLSGCSRGLSPISPYTASTTLSFVHSGGSQVIFSDPPQLFNLYAAKANDETITGSWSFPSPSTSQNPATKGYVDGGILAGAATSTESVTGISRLATKLQQASSTATTVNTPLVLQAQNATSTYNAGTAGGSGLNVVVTQNNNTIDSNFISTSSVYTWSGGSTFTASTTLNATTTIAASSATNNALVLNTVKYAFPSSQGSVGTILSNNGSGVLSWSAPPRYTFSDPANVTADSNSATATSTSITIPAGVVTASSTIDVFGYITSSATAGGSSNCTVAVRAGTGAPFVSITQTAPTSKSIDVGFHALILPNNSTSAQNNYLYGNGQATDNTPINLNTESTSAINLSNSFSITINMKAGASNVSTCDLLNFAVIVNP